MKGKLDWDGVVEDLGPRLFRHFCLRFPKQIADELTQETLFRLVRKVEGGQFDPEKGTLTMLAFGIARFVRLEALKPSRNDPYHEQAGGHSFPEIDSDLAIRDLATKIRRLMGNLSTEEQEVFALVVDGDLTLAEIGVLLQMPEGTVKSHVFRAKKKLLALIHEEKLV